jgi:hypothetical protein
MSSSLSSVRCHPDGGGVVTSGDVAGANDVLDGSGQYTNLFDVVKDARQTPHKTIIVDSPSSLLHYVGIRRGGCGM